SYNVIVVESATPGCIDTAVPAPGIDPHRGSLVWCHTNADITSAATLHPGELTGKIEYIHKSESLRICVVSHTDCGELSRALKGIHIEPSLVPFLGSTPGSDLAKQAFLLVLFQFQVDGFFIITIFKSCKLRLVTLFVVHLHFIYRIRGQILGRDFGIV